MAAVPATEVQGRETASGSTPADAQREPGTGGHTPAGHTIAAPAGTEAVPAIANTVVPSITPATAQGDARIATAGSTATAGLANDASVSAVDAPTASPADSQLARTPAAAPLHRQLLGPIATLAAGPNGERTLSVNIAPEALGPITVKALLGGEGIRMELSAPTDAGREALRSMLPELRRELAATGSGTITVSTSADSPSTPGGHTGSHGAGGGDARPFTGSASPAQRIRDELPPETPGQETSTARHNTSHLDVMA